MFVFGVEGGGGVVTSAVNMVTGYILKVTSTFTKHVQENVAPDYKE